MKRWGRINQGTMVTMENGNWVEYEDAQAEIDKLKAEIKKLKESNDG